MVSDIHPLIPMLAITGNPSNRQIETMLSSYRTVGIDAVMVYPRSGLGVPYMSEAWRALCSRIIEAARRQSMRLWLYDEINWPSGSCGNQVAAENPDFAARRLVYADGAVRLETVRPGQAERVMEPFDNDMLNPEAVRCFIRLTHERYKEWFGSDFGGVIAGIFTDEPSFIYTANRPGMYPYYDGVEEDYAAACGGDLTEDLVAFEQGRKTEHFPGVYRTLIGARFKTAYIDQIAAWCRKNGLLLTGHTLSDDMPLTATRETGDWFSFIERMDVPGVDEIPTRLGAHDDVLFSMAENLRENGKDHVMAEVFALGPCSMSFARRRQMLWYAAAHGVDTFFVAISHLNAAGNVKKPDFFDNFNHFNPDFDGVRLLAAEAEKAAALAAKRTVNTVGLLCPYSAYLSALGRRRESAVEKAFEGLADQLTERQIGWRILREGESDDRCPLLFAVTEDGVIERRSGRRYTVDEAVRVAVAADAGPRVTDAAGRLMSHLMIKSYQDGSVVVVDRANQPLGRRSCLLHTKTRVIPFLQESHGVFLYVPGDAAPLSPCHSVPCPSVRVRSLDPAVLRASFFEGDTFTFTVSELMTVRLHRRVYPDASGTVLLDGQTLRFSLPSAELTDCFAPLYRSVECTLSPGAHRLQTDLVEYPYLPAALITGAFRREGCVLSSSADTDIYRFFGRLEVTVPLSIPATATAAALCMEDCGLYVTAEVGGERVGERAFAPYRFPIPGRLFGRSAEMTLTFHSTLAPLFGDLDEWMEEGVFRTAWDDVPASTPERLTLAALAFREEWQ